MRRVGVLFHSRTTEFYPDKPTRSRRLSRKQKYRLRKAEKQRGKTKSKAEFQYGFEVPKNWDDIIRIDNAAGNTKWQDAVEKEVTALIHFGCFAFMGKNFKPASNYQYCCLHFVYAVKNNT